MKTLILGTCYISEAKEGAQNYGAKLVEMWAKLNIKLNPDADILLVDSKSPGMPVLLDRNPSWSEDVLSKIKVFTFADNIGHINTTGKDGWGRAFCYGVQHAIHHDYDYLAYVDADIICTQPVQPIIDKLARTGVKAACPWDSTYGFPENGLMYLSVPYLRDSNFVERYDWPNRTRSSDVMQIPEIVFERLMGDDLFILPMRGLRNDFDTLTVNNFVHRFPYGVDYLTHCKDFRLYEMLLKSKGIEL